MITTKTRTGKPGVGSGRSKRIPPLQNGDRLTRVEFERRYRSMPNQKKAELIEGIVFMPSPVSLLDHGEPHAYVIMWLGFYKMGTPGIRVGDNGTLRLDPDNEPQPDAFVLIEQAHGGQAKIGPDGYVEGAPELVVEVAASTVSIDMHKKLDVYRRNGVMEYVVWRVQDEAISWFVQQEGEYIEVSPEVDGLYHSLSLPGLVLDPAALISGDLMKLSEDQTRAFQTDEHREFVATFAGEGS